MNDTSIETETYNVGLTLTDIQNTIKVIDHACDQGAFRGWDVINSVQQVRNRLNHFIGAALAAQEQAKNATDGESAPDEQFLGDSI